MKRILAAVMVAAMPAMLLAQSAISAYDLSQSDLRGTARFMSMAGAFGALGGDLSTLGQNPAGIGLYRSSEVGITLDVDFESSNTYNGANTENTRAMVTNLGYVGSFNLNSDVMPYFQWGVTYGRRASFDRTVIGNIDNIGVSLSDFAAFSANGFSPNELGYERKMDDNINNPVNPYDNTNADWLSILAFNSYTINSMGGDKYRGLFNDNDTYGSALYNIRQRGYIDEYNINFGGNIMNTLYWGLGIGIADISLRSETYYEETLYNADVAASHGMGSAVITGDAFNSLGNYSSVSGTGFNLKIGAIVKPINELRFGFAIETPTWYRLNQGRHADLYYEYYKPNEQSPFNSGTSYTNDSYFDWKLRTPWTMTFSAATVVGGKFILSLDYEYKAFQDMRVKNDYGTEDTYVTTDVKDYFKPQNTIRVGAEFRVTPQFSLRAGFADTMSAIKKGVDDGDVNVYTNGNYVDNANPAYTFDTNTRYISCGLGYKYKAFSFDLAYVNKFRQCTYHPFSSFGGNGSEVLPDRFYAPSARYSISDNNLVVSVGFKF